MYTSINFKTKKQLKEALANGRKVGVYSPGPFPCPDNGKVTLEGPHYPEPHKWYAQAIVENGYITSVK
jgi:hypothetical protein